MKLESKALKLAIKNNKLKRQIICKGNRHSYQVIGTNEPTHSSKGRNDELHTYIINDVKQIYYIHTATGLSSSITLSAINERQARKPSTHKP